MPDIRAKDVVVDTIRRARCTLPGCTWRGEEHRASHMDADAERGAADGAPGHG